jgi:hypothetical protein
LRRGRSLWGLYADRRTSFSISNAGKNQITPCVFVSARSAGDPCGVVMLDIVMLAIGVGAFALLIGYVALCERL